MLQQLGQVGQRFLAQTRAFLLRSLGDFRRTCLGALGNLAFLHQLRGLGLRHADQAVGVLLRAGDQLIGVLSGLAHGFIGAGLGAAHGLVGAGLGLGRHIVGLACGLFVGFTRAALHLVQQLALARQQLFRLFQIGIQAVAQPVQQAIHALFIQHDQAAQGHLAAGFHQIVDFADYGEHLHFRHDFSLRSFIRDA